MRGLMHLGVNFFTWEDEKKIKVPEGLNLSVNTFANIGVPMNKCRVCGHQLYDEPLLRYGNMPAVAQFLPDAEALPSDMGVDLEVRQCSGCGLVQLSNDPVPYYREVIRAAAISMEMKEFRQKQFGGFIEKYALHGKKVLEVGCGRGEYLSIMREAGADTFGLEWSEESVRDCLVHGLEAARGYVESVTYKVQDGPFDAFYMLNFLEHLPDLNSVLAGIRNNLGENGIGLVEVPNFDMILRNKLFTEFTTDHLFYFTRETLIAALNLNGFEIIECTEVWYDYIISAVVRKRKKTDITHFHDYQAKLKNEINWYISRFRDGGVAVWGAGHQALAVMSLANLSDKVKYVVDSAPFKQGKYTPATHLPIVSPDALVSDPVDAVIVMAASYSDEVARTIRQKFDAVTDIAILRDYGLEFV